MRKDQTLRVLSELRDLEIFDSEDQLCGIADEVEFEGEPGKPLRITAIIVGPGAYRGRLPGWLAGLAHLVAGRRAVKVPWEAVETVTSRIKLADTAEALGLAVVERRLKPFFSKLPMAT